MILRRIIRAGFSRGRTRVRFRAWWSCALPLHACVNTGHSFLPEPIDPEGERASARNRR